jgi:SAM-dependent methyltransferase
VGWLGSRIKKNGIEISDRYARTEDYFDLTPAGRTLIRTLDPLIEGSIRGRTLDAGAGRLTYHSRLARHAATVVSMDRFRIREGLTVQGDVDFLPFAPESFDSIFCSQVLEHVPNPFQAMAEFSRVLAPGGGLVLSVPHLAYLHNEPHDYYRYTEYGLRQLAKEAGLEVTEVRWSGGVLSFLGHFPSTLILNLTWEIPVLFPFCFHLNRLWTRLIAALESGDASPRRFALNMAVVARKRERG